MSTITSICRELTALLLLIAVLMLPLDSVARDLSPAAAKDSCACQSLANEPAADANQEQTDPCPGSNTGDCCDSQELNSDAAAAPLLGASRTTISDRQLFHPSAAGLHPRSISPSLYLQKADLFSVILNYNRARLPKLPGAFLLYVITDSTARTGVSESVGNSKDQAAFILLAVAQAKFYRSENDDQFALFDARTS